jgi:hypothetical protein
MSKREADEIRTTVEKIGRRVLETGEAKKITSVDSVDDEGTIHKTTEVEKGLNDCGHYGETGAVCQACNAFTICEADAKSEKFACSSCGRICCPHCSVESIFHPGVRFCHRCGFRGLMREALKERK